MEEEKQFVLTDLFNHETYPIDTNLEECFDKMREEGERFWYSTDLLKDATEEDCDHIALNYYKLSILIINRMLDLIDYDDAIDLTHRKIEDLLAPENQDNLYKVKEGFDDIRAMLAIMLDLKNGLTKKYSTKAGRKPIDSLAPFLSDDLTTKDEQYISNEIKAKFEQYREVDRSQYRIMMAAVDAKLLKSVPTSAKFYLLVFSIRVSSSSMGEVNDNGLQDKLRHEGKQGNKKLSSVYTDALKRFKEVRAELLKKQTEK